jgi:hypothetical protein
LSGWPSDTDSLVKKYSLRDMGEPLWKIGHASGERDLQARLC